MGWRGASRKDPIIYILRIVSGGCGCFGLFVPELMFLAVVPVSDAAAASRRWHLNNISRNIFAGF